MRHSGRTPSRRPFPCASAQMPLADNWAVCLTRRFTLAAPRKDKFASLAENRGKQSAENSNDLTLNSSTWRPSPPDSSKTSVS